MTELTAISEEELTDADWVEGEEAEMVVVDRQMFVFQQEGLTEDDELWYG